MKRGLTIITVILGAFVMLAGCQPAAGPAETEKSETNRELIYQVSTINALMQGVYDGETSFADLQGKGDLGIGTFEALDGEMILIDGVFYQVRADGKVYQVKGEMTCPFADLTYYDADLIKDIENIDSLAGLQHIVDTMRCDANHFYAIRVDGTFKYIKARSVPPQTEPYPPLSEAVKQQVVFEYEDIEGSIIGFWSPQFVDGVNMPGYHFHFISKDRQRGGHLLEARIQKAQIGVDYTTDFAMHLPEGEAFSSSNLSQDQSQALEKAER